MFLSQSRIFWKKAKLFCQDVFKASKMAFRAVLPTVPNLSRAFGGPDSVLSWAKIELEIVTVKIKIGIEIFERLIAFILA